MVLTHSIPAMCFLGVGLILGFLSGRGRFVRGAAFSAVACGSTALLFLLMEGGTLCEGLACLLLPVFLIMPRGEKT